MVLYLFLMVFMKGLRCLFISIKAGGRNRRGCLVLLGLFASSLPMIEIDVLRSGIGRCCRRILFWGGTYYYGK